MCVHIWKAGDGNTVCLINLKVLFAAVFHKAAVSCVAAGEEGGRGMTGGCICHHVSGRYGRCARSVSVV